VKDVAPLKVQIAITRWQGDKKVSSTPYTLSMNVPLTQSGPPSRPANLRMGTKVPIVMMSAPPVPGPEGKEVHAGPIQYQDIGTNIDCFARVIDGGRYVIDVSIEETSLLDAPGKANEHPSIRSFRASDSVVLKDGQSGQFTAATDKLTGEVTKVDVTLTVVK
jgi:hypothetical protein